MTCEQRLANAINGQYDFELGNILSHSLDRLKGYKGVFWGATLLTIVVLFAINLVSEIILGVILALVHKSQLGVFLITAPIGIALVIAEYWIQLSMKYAINVMGIRRSCDMPFRFTLIFDYFPYGGKLIATMLLMILLLLFSMLIIGGGIYILSIQQSTLFLIIGIITTVAGFIATCYLAVGLSFSLPLIVEKKIGCIEAMTVSFKTVNHHWFKIFGTLLVIGLIGISGVLLLLIGLIWTLPWANIAFGTLYREIFGVEPLTEDELAKAAITLTTTDQQIEQPSDNTKP